MVTRPISASQLKKRLRIARNPRSARSSPFTP
jgi:hypothetical protein